jgi:hypothetical protein
MSISYYFKKWRDIVSFRKYDEWCKIQEELNNENEGWQCKYGDCERH